MIKHNRGENMEDKTLFVLTEEDAQILAAQMEIEPLTDDQIRRVRRGVESGLEGWSDVLEAAIREAVRA